MRETYPDPVTGPAQPNDPSARPPIRRISMGEVMHMRATIGIFRRHLWAFLIVAGLVPACAWIAVQRTTPRYTASGSLIYEPSDYKVRELESILRTDPTNEAVMAS